MLADLWRLIGRFDERKGKFKMKMDSFQREGAADQLLGGNAPRAATTTGHA